MSNQGTPRTTREAIANALAELRRTSPHNCDPLEKAVDVIEAHLRDRHAHDATCAELQGLSPLEMFNLMYPKSDDDTEPGGGLME